MKAGRCFFSLEQEGATFLKNFVLKSGSLKEIAKLYEVSYPTVRLRLDKLIQKIDNLFPFVVVNTIFLLNWGTGRDKYKQIRHSEMDKMKAKDI